MCSLVGVCLGGQAALESQTLTSTQTLLAHK